MAEPRLDSVTVVDGVNRLQTEPRDGVVPGITGVSETMLWSLYNRASEAKRNDSILVDPGSMHIQSSINYDFARHFGDPGGLLAARAAEIDRALRSWIARHPNGIVVSLGEGLETQRERVDNGRMRWLSVDLPDAIRLRERFLAPTDRFRHAAVSALDPAWMDEVDASSGVFIVAQGLLMYLAPERVRQLFVIIADRFPGAELAFDAIPRWFSELTLRGLQQTAFYQLPSMPWGINRDEVEPTLRRWHPGIAAVTFLAYQSPRGLPQLLAEITNRIPVARHAVPCLVHVAIAQSGRSPVKADAAADAGSGLRPAHETSRLAISEAPDVTAMDDRNAAVAAVGGFLAAATQNAKFTTDIAVAASHVIAKRVALGMAATLDPLRSDGAEFSRMLPEKVEAFSSAGLAMLKQTRQANRHMMDVASHEVLANARATVAMIGCRSPAALVDAQGRFARAWFSRLTGNWIAMGVRAFEAQSAAMAPIQRTVVANAERLAAIVPARVGRDC
jgi:O-methyltransferase involved in polyketide biosynthesis